MLRASFLSLSFVFVVTFVACLAAEDKKSEDQKSVLPAGDIAADVAQAIQTELFSVGPAGLEKYELQKAEFLKKYADDPARWQLKLIDAQVLSATGKSNKAILAEIAAGKDVPPMLQSTASALTFQGLAKEVKAGNAKFADLSAAADAHFTKFPTGPANRLVAHILVDASSAGDDAEKQLTALAASKNESISALAETKLKVVKIRKELTSKPLDLQFKSVDGRDVDFAKLRGKVVLVDFWATWCGPCMAEVPNVVATYKKLQSKGFEVVGISLDDDEGKLKQVVAEKEMSWPHHFDGKGWENTLAQKYGISSIPEMWLVDKKGMVHIFSRENELAEEVEKLLAE